MELCFFISSLASRCQEEHALSVRPMSQVSQSPLGSRWRDGHEPDVAGAGGPSGAGASPSHWGCSQTSKSWRSRACQAWAMIRLMFSQWLLVNRLRMVHDKGWPPTVSSNTARLSSVKNGNHCLNVDLEPLLEWRLRFVLIGRLRVVGDEW